MCINTFIQHIKSGKFRQFGFITNLLNPVHWFQFADDAAVISGQDSENQHLLNRFSIWCQWSNMIVRVDKCSTFGIRKSLKKSIEYLPKLLINNELIPATKIGESVRYLGKYFDFSMSEKERKLELITLMDDIMSEIDLKPLHLKNKLLLYSRYLLSKLSWHFTVTSYQTDIYVKYLQVSVTYLLQYCSITATRSTISAKYLYKSCRYFADMLIICQHAYLQNICIKVADI